MQECYINITVYGASNETYLKLCNNPKGFDQVTNAIKLLKDANIPIRINMTLTQYNVDDIEEIYKFAKCAFWVNWKGEMTPCGMMNEPKLNPFDIGFEEAWKEILNKTKKIFLPQECTNCKFKTICHVCPAVVYTETGEFNKKPSYLCDMTKYEYEQLVDV